MTKLKYFVLHDIMRDVLSIQEQKRFKRTVKKFETDIAYEVI